MSENNNNKSLIEYRLDSFENNLNANMNGLSGKIDTLLIKINESEIKQEAFKVRLEAIESEVKSIKRSNESTSDEISKIKVSIAEKLTWSAGGGVVASVITKLLGGS